MCGIYCSLSSTCHITPDSNIQQRLQDRGPDSSGTVRAIFHKANASDKNMPTNEVYITLYSTVLSLRGSSTISQPCQDTGGDYTLCWNGEAWSIAGQESPGNDTQLVYSHLVNALTHTALTSPTGDYSADDLARALCRIAGPYAFVFFDRSRGKLFFGRDFLGRRSLLTRVTQEGDFVISSVSDGNNLDDWTEVEADWVYCIDLNGAEGKPPAQRCGHFVYTRFPYVHSHAGRHGTDVTYSVGHEASTYMSTLAHAKVGDSTSFTGKRSLFFTRAAKSELISGSDAI